MKLAPIVLFTYKRLDTLIQTVEALQKNYLSLESDLIIYSDAAKDEKDQQTVKCVRNYIKLIDGFKTVTIYESKENKGLANSIISGVSEVLEKNESVIVLEDDLVTTPNFLNFMNLGLDQYKNEKRVNALTGYSFDLKKKASSSAYFLNRPWPWSWATWKDKWVVVDWELKNYNSFSRDRLAKKNFSKLGSDVNSMLENQMNGKLDSWAIRWTFHQFQIDSICLYPPVSLIRNIGFGEEATHTKGSYKRYETPVVEKYPTDFILPKLIEVSTNDQNSFLKIMGIQSRIKSKFESVILIIYLNFFRYFK